MKLIQPGDKGWPPRKVRNAAKILTEWAQLHGIKYWRIQGVCSREALEDIENGLMDAGLLSPEAAAAIQEAQKQP